MNYFKYVLIFLCFANLTYAQGNESLSVSWPKEYKFKVGNTIDNADLLRKEFVPVNESVLKWTIHTENLCYKNMKLKNPDKAILMAQEFFVHGPNAKLTVLEKNDSTNNWWVLYKVEGGHLPVGSKEESTLYYELQGTTNHFILSVSIRESKLSQAFIEKWTAVFKAGQLVNK